MALFGKRKTEQVSIESEQERIHAIRIAAEQELGRLRRELTERVAAVEQRERELADAVARVNRSAGRVGGEYDAAVDHAQSGLAAHAHELNRRERDLESREKALLRMESDLARRAAAAALCVGARRSERADGEGPDDEEREVLHRGVCRVVHALG